MTDTHGLITPQGGRLGSKQAFYYAIAEDAFVECVKLSVERETIQTISKQLEDEDAKLKVLEDRQLSASVRCIVFAGMCLEAAIYDYAAWHLPPVVVEGLDKVDFLSKWRMIPLLVAKHEIPAGQLTHNSLKSLLSLRNRLVHAKSERMAYGDALLDQVSRFEKNSQEIAEGYIVAIEAVVAASIEMDLHSPMTFNPLPHFIPARNSQLHWQDPVMPAELSSVIAKCRRSLKAE